MSSSSKLRDAVRELFSPLCSHEEGYHLELFFVGREPPAPRSATAAAASANDGSDGSGAEDGDGGGRGDGGADDGEGDGGESGPATAMAAALGRKKGDGGRRGGGGEEDAVAVAAAAVTRQQRPRRRWRERRCSAENACVLNIFVSGKRFLARDAADRFYYRFSGIWVECESGRRETLSLFFRRILMTRSFFVFLAYIYLLQCICEVCEIVPVFGLRRRLPWRELEARLCRYPHDRLELLMDNANLHHLGELHRHVLGVEFRLPFPNQTSAPCIPVLRVREHDTEGNAPVVYRHRWIRRRRRLRSGSGADPLRAESAPLVEALRRHAGDAPCGNPMYAMGRALVERFCRRGRRYLVPLARTARGARSAPRCLGVDGFQGVSGIMLFALSVALKAGIVNSVIDLPVTCHCKTKCERYAAPGALSAVICRNCGHCLNLGKEKLNCTYGFPLNSMFYYRDRQEKSVVYSTHNELAHCSLCGSQYLDIERIYDLSERAVAGFSVSAVSWKAVTGSNAACTVYGHDAPFDVIVPCSSRTCYSTVILKNVVVGRLLRLVCHANDFICQLCPGAARESCLDRDRCDDPCRGCRVAKLFGCRRYTGSEDV